jgi:single-stranded-DNA-specific exonuclease
MNRYRWIETPAAGADDARALERALEIPHAGARLLVARGVTDPDAARRFLAPSPRDVHDPFLFARMDEAVEHVRAALASGKPILIHGDYDVDGISGTALLFRYLDGLGPEVLRFVPDRRKDGYGVADRAVNWAIEKKVGLVIAVDCGTSDVERIERLQDAGIDAVVCDHHAFRSDGRQAGVMLNPVRPGEGYPFGGLCGAGVAHKLVQALHARDVRGNCAPEELLDLVALATVGDMAPLEGENRYLVRAGLEQMNRAPRAGIAALRGEARIGTRSLTARHLSFAIAPRINAPGRVTRPKPALEILCEDRTERARALARQLDLDNEHRRSLTRAVEEDAVTRIRAMTDRDEAGAFVLASPEWDEGVLGIAATRVVEEFGRPTILMSISGDVAKGSGRSIAGVNLKEQLDRFAPLFDRYGGHAQAVGLTMRADRVAGFGREMAETLRAFVPAYTGLPLAIDAEIGVDECTDELLNFLARCEPFGLGNREPVWKITDVQVMPTTTLLGSRNADGRSHLKLFFQDGRGVPGQAIAFGWDRPQTPEDLHGRAVDIAVRVVPGEYRGRVYAELRLLDLRPAGGGGS